ncbi:MAG: hypothetical protein GXP45_03110 [bacterium]|nr:hypothetical protein [bacterium]
MKTKIFLFMIGMMFFSCTKEEIQPYENSDPKVVLVSPDSINEFAVDKIFIGAYNLNDRFYAISFQVQGKDDGLNDTISFNAIVNDTVDMTSYYSDSKMYIFRLDKSLNVKKIRIYNPKITVLSQESW